MRLLRQVKGVLIDLSGTIHIENEAIPGALYALTQIKSSGLPYLLVTNTTKESLSMLEERLRKCGFPEELYKNRLHTTLTSCLYKIREEKLRPFFLVDKNAMEDFPGCTTDNPNCVVVGLSPDDFNYDKLDSAFHILMKEDSQLLALNKSRYFKKADQKNHLGAGAFVTGLEFSTGKKATVVGKPEKSFFMSAVEKLGVAPEDVAMIGDDARDDVAGAKESGLMGILVRTGKYSPQDENAFQPEPDLVCHSIVNAVDAIFCT